MKTFRLMPAILALLAFAALCLNAAPPTGTVSVYLLKSGKPMQGSNVLIDGTHKHVTDADGYFKAALDCGKHILEVLPIEAGKTLAYIKYPFEIVEGKNTQVILTLKADNALSFADVERPEGPACAATVDLNASAVTGTFKIRLISSEEKKPIAGARIFVKGGYGEGVTDKNGELTMELPEGTQVISIVHTKYSSMTIKDAEVTGNTLSERTVELSPAGVELEEFIVLAPGVSGSIASVMLEQKETDSVADIIGAEQFSKQGDSDAAGALKRVSGLTLVGGKFIYIRGLGERYSSSRLNELNLPSPEPTKRVVPLDLFPTGVIKSIKIQKTHSADLPANFGGGNIDIRTKDVPKEFFFNFDVTGKYLSGTTLDDYNTYEGSSSDWTGYDDSRGLNDYTRAIADSFTSIDSISEQGQEVVLRDLAENSGAIEQKKAPLGFKISSSVGDRFDITDDISLGYIFSYSYDNMVKSRTEQRGSIVVSNGAVLPPTNYEPRVLSDHEIKHGGLAGASIGFYGLHNLKWTTFYVNHANDVVSVTDGTNEDSTVIRRTYLSWVERELLIHQLAGDHTFDFLGNLQLSWAGELGKAQRYEPLTREYTYSEQNGVYVMTNKYTQQFTSSDLEDKIKDYYAELRYPFFLTGDDEYESFVEIGYNNNKKERDSKTRRFSLGTDGNSWTEEERAGDVDSIFDETNIDRLKFSSTYRAADYYTAHQYIRAYYAKANIKPHPFFEFELGVRKEESEQAVNTYSGDTPVEYTLDTNNYLPSALITLNLSEDTKLRFAYSKTISRPDFREFAPVRYQDPETGDIINGNGDLTFTKIKNYDARWEWYLSATESLSTAFFYKTFDKPIETVSEPYDTPTFTYINAESATLWGIELGFRKSGGFIADWLEDWYTAGNFTYSKSSISLNPNDDAQKALTSQTRPMQGHSPYVINAQLGYDNLEDRTVTLLYNVFGKRIMGVGQLDYPDIYEKPFHELNLVWVEKLGKNFSFKSKIKNILDDEVEWTQGGSPIRTYKKGTQFEVGVSFKY